MLHALSDMKDKNGERATIFIHKSEDRMEAITCSETVLELERMYTIKPEPGFSGCSFRILPRALSMRVQSLLTWALGARLASMWSQHRMLIRYQIYNYFSWPV